MDITDASMKKSAALLGDNPIFCVRKKVKKGYIKLPIAFTIRTTNKTYMGLGSFP